MKVSRIHWESWRDCLLVATLLACLFLLCSPFSTLPPFWDGVSFVSYSLRAPETGFSIPFYDHHPILFPFFLGNLYKYFGYSPVLTHGFLFLLGCLTVFFTFKTVKLIFNFEVAAITSLFLIISPLFLAVLINPNLDIMVCTFIIASYYYFLRKNYVVYAILASFALLSKESASIWIVAIGASFLAESWLKTRIEPNFSLNRHWCKDLAKIMVPFIVTCGWLLFNWVTWGSLIHERKHPLFTLSLPLYTAFYKSVGHIFFLNLNWVYWIFILVFIITAIIRSFSSENVVPGNNFIISFKFMISQTTMLVFPGVFFVILYLLVISPLDDFQLPRYTIIIYPVVLMFGAYAMRSVLKKRAIVLLFISLFSLLLILQNFSTIDPVMKKYTDINRYTGAELEFNAEFSDYVLLEQDGFLYLSENLHNRTILFDWWNPLHVIELSRLHKDEFNFGYNSNSSWTYLWVQDFFSNATDPEEGGYVYMTHKLSEDFSTFNQKCVLTEEFFRERNGKELWIYDVSPSCYRTITENKTQINMRA